MGIYVSEILEGPGQKGASAMPALAETMEWSTISRQIRSNMGLGRDKFARLLQVSPRTVMRWENADGGEPIMPQNIQRMKLLALYLNSETIEDQQAILTDLLQQASELRSQYERKATTIREYDIVLHSDLPPWFEDLSKLRAESNWRAILLMGPHFLPRRAAAGTDQARIEAVVSLWVGNAAFMCGDPQSALEYYERALETAGNLPPVLRAVLHANKGYALIRLNQFDAADSALRESLRIDPAHRGALRNRLALYSLAEDEEAAYEAALDLKSRYAETDDPARELGQLVLQDPDLKFFRSTESFSRAFPALAERSIAA